MITIFVKMTFKPEFKDEAKKLVMELVEKTSKQDYCESYEAFEDLNDINTIVIKECFFNRISLTKHKTYIHYNEILKGKLDGMIQEKNVNFVTKLSENYL